MKETGEKENLADRLAEFTDQVLARKGKQVESGADDELRRLEELILRLMRAVPHTQLDESTVKRMQAKLKARLSSEVERTKVNFWQNWFRANRFHPQFGFVLCAVLILVFALFIAPHLTQSGPSISAVATRPSPFVFILALLSGITLLVIWISHRQ
jgi:hypothetical protein